MGSRLALVLLVLSGCVLADAQNNGQVKTPETRGRGAAGGVVTGVVVCEDTQRPARFAEVRLVRKLTTDQTKLTSENLVHGAAKGVDPAVGEATGWAQTLTGMDGRFRVDHLQPGDYFVVASARGYLIHINPLPPLDEHTKLIDQNKMLEGLPLVHVIPGGEAVVNMSLERASVITGSVRYEDGSPAIGIQVEAHPLVDPFVNQALPPFFALPRGLYSAVPTTDDEGHYRLSGLPPGKYRIRATLEVEEHGQYMVNHQGVPGISEGQQELDVFAPHTLRVDDAEVIEVKPGESHPGVDIELNLNGLHTIRGLLTAADHHGLAEAGVTLTQGDGKGFERIGSTDIDGGFRLDYVPAGSYTLTLDSIRDLVPGSYAYENKVLQPYNKVVRTVVVADGDTDLGNLEAVAVEKPATQSGDEKK